MNQEQKQLLNALSNALFNTHYPITTNMLKEAYCHAVLPLVFDQCEKENKWQNVNFNYLRKNMQIEYQHKEVDRLMKENHIPYVILKGCASGRYYPDPTLRCYGDVDFLVYPEDMERARVVLEAEGFKGEEDDGKNKHVAFHRQKGEVWELHRYINGFHKEIKEMIPTSIYTGCYQVPNDYHHCLILLFHTASHITSSGIGLRHLCDWAVFVNKVNVVQWKKELEEYGLWRFAQILTAVCVEYLGLPKQGWEYKEDELTDQLIEDILSSGNFGRKDDTRHQQTKYIISRDKGSVDNKSVILQVLFNIKVKAKEDHKSVVNVMLQYLIKVFKRKQPLKPIYVLDEANKRKKLYSALKLFETD